MPDRDRLIFHIDVNSAFLSWTALERLAQGDSVDLRTIPAIVGGDTSTRHGVVLAKSIPAKGLRYHYGGACGQRPAEMSSSGHGLSGSFHVPRKKPAAHGTSVRYLPGH